MAAVVYRRRRPGAVGRQVQSHAINDEISNEKFIEQLKEYKIDSKSKKVILGLLPKSSSLEGN
jgi:hypothetical protein